MAKLTRDLGGEDLGQRKHLAEVPAVVDDPVASVGPQRCRLMSLEVMAGQDAEEGLSATDLPDTDAETPQGCAHKRLEAIPFTELIVVRGIGNPVVNEVVQVVVGFPVLA